MIIKVWCCKHCGIFNIVGQLHIDPVIDAGNFLNKTLYF